jgi:hypothetical protein
MVTNRTPRRVEKMTKVVTDRAVETFKQMQTLPPCTCVWGPKYWNRIECASCDRWWDLHRELHAELKLRPWEWPAVDHPPGAPPHDELKASGGFPTLSGEPIVRRSMSQAPAPADWVGARELFDELTRLSQ